MDYIKKENYCSCSPDGLFGVRFNYGCYLHDRQYRNEVKNRKTRKQADKDLKRMIIDIYSDSTNDFKFFRWKTDNKILIWIRNKILSRIIAQKYYLAVRLFGKKAWN